MKKVDMPGAAVLRRLKTIDQLARALFVFDEGEREERK
jgi:hypothetical protein